MDKTRFSAGQDNMTIKALNKLNYKKYCLNLFCYFCNISHARQVKLKSTNRILKIGLHSATKFKVHKKKTFLKTTGHYHLLSLTKCEMPSDL